MPVVELYSLKGIAKELGISPQSVANFRARHKDTPLPTHHVAGMPLWTRQAVKSWKRWYTQRVSK